MARVKPTKQKTNNGANVGYEAELWQMADALRGSTDAAEYKHVVLGLIFLQCISDAFEDQHAKLVAKKAPGADSEDLGRIDLHEGETNRVKAGVGPYLHSLTKWGVVAKVPQIVHGTCQGFAPPGRVIRSERFD
jgi:hypothetical protein